MTGLDQGYLFCMIIMNYDKTYLMKVVISIESSDLLPKPGTDIWVVLQKQGASDKSNFLLIFKFFFFFPIVWFIYTKKRTRVVLPSVRVQEYYRQERRLLSLPLPTTAIDLIRIRTNRGSRALGERLNNRSGGSSRGSKSVSPCKRKTLHTNFEEQSYFFDRRLFIWARYLVSRCLYFDFIWVRHPAS